MLAVALFSALLPFILAGEVVSAFNMHASTPLQRRTAKHRRKGKDCTTTDDPSAGSPPVPVGAVMAAEVADGDKSDDNVVWVDETVWVTETIQPTPTAITTTDAADPLGDGDGVVGAVMAGNGDGAGGGEQYVGDDNVVYVDVTSTVMETVYAGQPSPSPTPDQSQSAPPPTTPTTTTTKHRIPEVAAVAIKTDENGSSSIIYDTVSSAGAQYTDAPEATGGLTQGPTWEGQWRWVEAHNKVRQQYGAEDVNFREDLAKLAEEKAKLCNKAHTKAAENLQWGSGFGSPEGAVEGWASEASMYNWNAPGYQDAWGHFTQVVWKETKYIGCYIADCSMYPGSVVDAKYNSSFQAACEYDPAGNFVGEEPFRENVGQRKW
ncbi:hypothetical protein I317_01191 [Kwoniella heveanensis CBS 569]|nr:hypothetical protein I317_01191 [Kwoniella heveanensis CBS 569]